MEAAVQGALYLKQLLKNFSIQQKRPIALIEDNQSCIILCRNLETAQEQARQGKILLHLGQDGEWGYQFSTFRLTKGKWTSLQSPQPYRR